MQNLINQFHNLEFFEMCSKIDDNSIDMILCDLPYGTTACKWDVIIPFDRMWEQFKRISKPNTPIVLTASQPFTSTLIVSNLDMFRYEWIWVKSRANGFLDANRKPMKKHENVLVFSEKPSAYYPQDLILKYKPNKNSGNENVYGKVKKGYQAKVTFTNYPDSILNFGSIKNIHPTQKPVSLFEYLIKTYTCENDLVFDPCCGSGTTGIAAHNTNRRFICSDNGFSDKHKKSWVEISQERLIKIEN